MQAGIRPGAGRLRRRGTETPAFPARCTLHGQDGQSVPDPAKQQGPRQMPGTDANELTPDDIGGKAAGSNVLPFPGRLRPVAGASAPGMAPPEAEDAAARLDRVLLALTQALAEQREAVRAWRQGLVTLAGSMNSLADGLCALDAELEAASAKLKVGTNGQLGCPQGEEASWALPAPAPEPGFSAPHRRSAAARRRCGL